MLAPWAWEGNRSANPGDGFIASDQKSSTSLLTPFFFLFKLVLPLYGQISFPLGTSETGNLASLILCSFTKVQGSPGLNIYLETTDSWQSTSDHRANPPRVAGSALEELRVKNITWDFKIIPEFLELDCSSDDKPTQAEKEK